MTLHRFSSSLCLLAASASLSFAQNYKVVSSIPLGGTGGWDYLSVDTDNRRLYVSHGTEVEVVDLDAQKAVGKITGLAGVHGIAIAKDQGEGFISDGRNNEIVAFDLKSLAVKAKVKAGTNPDGILYDAFSHRVFAFNGRSQDATVVDAASQKVLETIHLDGKPEFPISDGKGNVYVNIEDKSEIEEIDAKALTVKAHWSIKPCESPSGLAFDAEHRRLFSVCDNGLMAITDADSGKVVGTAKIGEGPDAAAFDAKTGLIFSSNGESGTLTIVQAAGNDRYEVKQTVTTAKGARTMTLDPKTHRVYLSIADFKPAPAETPRARPQAVPGTFRLLVAGSE